MTTDTNRVAELLELLEMQVNQALAACHRKQDAKLATIVGAMRRTYATLNNTIPNASKKRLQSNLMECSLTGRPQVHFSRDMPDAISIEGTFSIECLQKKLVW